VTTPHHPQQPSTSSVIVVPAPDRQSTSEISFDDLAVVTGGADDNRLVTHELAHVVQQRRGR
jgi:hypothetical protein